MSVKTKLADWLIKKKLQSRNHQGCVCSLNNAKSAGILWLCDDQVAYKALASILKEMNISTKGFCFSEQPISIKGESVFSKQDFNWLGLPKSEQANEFVDTKFDLLIDISMAESKEAQAIRALSMAKFKAGWSQAKPSYFDLQIDVSKRQEPSFLAEQIVHYLNGLSDEKLTINNN